MGRRKESYLRAEAVAQDAIDRLRAIGIDYTGNGPAARAYRAALTCMRRAHEAESNANERGINTTTGDPTPTSAAYRTALRAAWTAANRAVDNAAEALGVEPWTQGGKTARAWRASRRVKCADRLALLGKGIDGGENQ